MKTIKKLSLMLAIAFATILTSCGGDNEGSSIAIPATGSYINAKVDGADFTTVIAGQSAATASRSDSGGTTTILVGGSSVSLSDITSQKNIAISLNGITATGTYPINTNSGSAFIYTLLSSGSTISYATGDCANATGSVTITTLNATTIEGTFNFVGKRQEACSESKSVTNGSFRGMFQ